MAGDHDHFHLSDQIFTVFAHRMAGTRNLDEQTFPRNRSFYGLPGAFCERISAAVLQEIVFISRRTAQKEFQNYAELLLVKSNKWFRSFLTNECDASWILENFQCISEIPSAQFCVKPRAMRVLH